MKPWSVVMVAVMLASVIVHYKRLQHHIQTVLDAINAAGSGDQRGGLVLAGLSECIERLKSSKNNAFDLAARTVAVHAPALSGWEALLG